MTLTYWVAQNWTGPDVYSIRTRTKREAVAQLAKHAPGLYGPLHKVTVEYTNAFDLLDQCSNEGHHYWESEAYIAPPAPGTLMVAYDGLER